MADKQNEFLYQYKFYTQSPPDTTKKIQCFLINFKVKINFKQLINFNTILKL